MWTTKESKGPLPLLRGIGSWLTWFVVFGFSLYVLQGVKYSPGTDAIQLPRRLSVPTVSILSNDPPVSDGQIGRANPEIGGGMEGLPGAAHSSSHVVEDYIMGFLVTLASAMFVAILIEAAMHSFPIELPHSVAWFLLGIGLGILGLQVHEAMFTKMTELSSTVIYMVLLPVLMYEGAVHVQWHQFAKQLFSHIWLATVGVVIQAFLIGAVMYFAMSPLRNSPDGLSESFLLGAALSSTDPVAVLSVLTTINCPLKLGSLFAGESLLNDGTSVVLYEVLVKFARGYTVTGGGVIWDLVRLAGVSPIFGWISAIAFRFVVAMLQGKPIFQAVWMIIGVYLVFVVGEHYLHLSGPLAAVCYGLDVCKRGYRSLSREAQETHSHALSAIACISESLIFCCGGFVSCRMVMTYGLEFVNFAYGGILAYFCMMVFRYGVLLISYPAIDYLADGLTMSEVALLGAGGLRGVIVISLALRIESDAELSSISRTHSPFYITVATIIILVVNGTLFELFYKMVQPYPPGPFRCVLLKDVLMYIDRTFETDVTPKLENKNFSKNMRSGSNVSSNGGTNISTMDNPLTFSWTSYKPAGDEKGAFEGSHVRLHSGTSAHSLLHHMFQPATSPTSPCGDMKLAHNTEFAKHLLFQEYFKFLQNNNVDGSILLYKWAIKLVPSFAGLGANGKLRIRLIKSSGVINEFLQEISAMTQAAVVYSTHDGMVDIDNQDYKDNTIDDGLLNIHFQQHTQMNYKSQTTKHEDTGKSGIRFASGDHTEATRGRERLYSHADSVELCIATTGSSLPFQTVFCERRTEISLLILNYIRARYNQMYHSFMLENECEEILMECVDMTQDYVAAMAIITRGGYHSQFDEKPEHHARRVARLKRRKIVRALSATGEFQPFMVELDLLKKRLYCFRSDLCYSWKTIAASCIHKLSMKQRRQRCERDVQLIDAFISTHQDLAQNCGQEMQHLLQGTMLCDLRSAIDAARSMIGEMLAIYQEDFHEVILVKAARIFLDKKAKIVADTLAKGMLLRSDADLLLRALQDMKNKLNKDQSSFFMRFRLIGEA